MKKFKVTLSKLLTATVEIEAESDVEAMDEAICRYMGGEVELDGEYVQDGIHAVAEEIAPADGQMIQIFWDDLTESKQQEILAALGDNGNYDVFPIAEIAIPDGKEDSE